MSILRRDPAARSQTHAQDRCCRAGVPIAAPSNRYRRQNPLVIGPAGSSQTRMVAVKRRW